MKFLKEFENWNPVVNLEVNNFIETNKRYLMHLWDDSKSEEENIEQLSNFFRENPELMRDQVNLRGIKSINPEGSIKNMAPKLMNIGGVKDFRSF
jgi:hypothetical protein